MSVRLSAVCLSLSAGLLAAPLRAQTVPAGFTVAELVPGGLANPTAMARAPDGRVYIAQQSGDVRVWDPALGLQATPFATLDVDFNGERGLVGIAVDPNWLLNHFVYVHYSRNGLNGPVIERLSANPLNPNLALAGSAVTVVDLGNYPTTNNWHVGGGTHFGPDGKLYVGLGENGVSSNSQSIGNLFGKILRINPDPLNPIPSDNPSSIAGIAGTTSGSNRLIWAAGLRNPFTFAFHPVTGRLFLDDVGQSDWEEIDEGGAGRNYGWSVTEGDFDPVAFPGFTRPVYSYPHGTGFCIAGGAFYQPGEHSFPPDYFGDYFFGDFVSGWVKRLDVGTGVVTDFADGTFNVVDLKVDPQGRLLILTNDGPARLIRVSYTASLSPSILSNPLSRTVSAGTTVKLSTYAAGNTTLLYQWRRNSVPLLNLPPYSGVNSSSLTIAGVSCQTSDTYDCLVTNLAGVATSAPATVVGLPACYVNCDCSSVSPQLNISDFTCFVQKFTSGDAYANCDGSSAPPALNIFDFVCFMQKAAVGCP